MNEADAVLSTAEATWSLVYATAVLAILTFGVILSAVGVPWWQQHRDRSDELNRNAERDRQAENGVVRTVELVQEVLTFLDREVPFTPFPIWAELNRINTQRRVLKYFLGPGHLGVWMPYKISASLQALDEAASGLEQALRDQGDDDVERRALRRKEGAATARRALERLDAALREIKARYVFPS